MMNPTYSHESTPMSVVIDNPASIKIKMFLKKQFSAYNREYHKELNSSCSSISNQRSQVSAPSSVICNACCSSTPMSVIGDTTLMNEKIVIEDTTTPLFDRDPVSRKKNFLLQFKAYNAYYHKNLMAKNTVLGAEEKVAAPASSLISTNSYLSPNDLLKLRNLPIPMQSTCYLDLKKLLKNGSSRKNTVIIQKFNIVIHETNLICLNPNLFINDEVRRV